VRASAVAEPGAAASRPTGMGRIPAVLAGGATALVLLAGCANPSAVPPGGTTGPSGSATPSVSTPAASPLSGLRGTKVASIQCASTVWQPDQKTASVLPSTPVRLVICPLPMPNVVHPPADLRPPPEALLAALAAPDGPKPTASPYMCAAYADVPRLVYAQTASGDLYLLHIPVDACGHYLMHPMTELDQYANNRPLGQ
jgi:hypothetical protein